jgi:spermidine synthase
MGATLPILGRYYSRRDDRLGLTVGSLYAVNTLGGILGTFLSAFFLIPALGVRNTTFAAAILNLLIGGIVIFAVRTKEAGGQDQRHLPSDVSPPPLPGDRLAPRSLLVMFAFALSGFASMIYEVAWSRVLGLILDSSTYAFAIMLTTFLAGIALGSFLMSWVADRMTRPLWGFVLIEAAIGASAFLGLFLFAELPYLFVVLYRSFPRSLNFIFFSKFLLAGAVMFLPTLFIGALFPLVVRLYTRSLSRVGQSIGDVYSLNTLGCILGSFCGGFFFVPFLGIQKSILLAVALNFSLAFLLLIPLPFRRTRLKLSVMAALGLFFVALFLNVPRWNPSLMSSGVYMYVRFVLDLDRRQLLNRYTNDADPLLFYREGYSSTVSVHRSKSSENIYLKVNGKVEASTVGDMPTQVLLGQIPMLLSGSCEDVLVIGLGSGITVGSVSTHPARRITVAELEPAVVEASRLFARENFDVLKDPRVQVVTYDARNYLLVTPAKYDVIISEPSNPWMAGVSNLFTREFFLLGSRRLKPAGIFCQWLQLYKISPENLKSILATFHQVYPNLLVFEVENYDLIILGSFEPIRIDPEKLRRRIAESGVREDLGRVQIRSPGELLAHFLLGTREIPALTRKAPFNTDDNALLEFSAPKTLYSETSEENFRELARHSGKIDDYLKPAGESRALPATPRVDSLLRSPGSS